MWQIKHKDSARLSPLRLSEELALSLVELHEIADQAPSLYHEITIPKKSGGSRRLLVPQPELKILQRRLHDLLSNLFAAPPEVAGGIRGRDFVSHAERHRGQAFLLTMDIRAFFDTVSPAHVDRALEKLGLQAESRELIIKLGLREGRLPQGAPSSGFLANISLMDLDEVLLRLAGRRRLRYSRYLDDLAFSGAQDFKELKGPISQALRHQGFEVALEKTAYMGRHEPQIVTGLVVNDRLRPTRRFYEDLGEEMRLHRDRPMNERLHLKVGGRLNHLARFDRPAADRLKRRFGWATGREVRCRPLAALQPDC